MQSPLLDRVLLGTVQMGLPYGRTSGSGVMPESVAFGLLDAAWEIGIRRFDTAEAYGVSAARLSTWLDRTGKRPSASVVTKIGVASSERDIGAASARALARFDGVRELTLLSHGPAAGEVWELLKQSAVGADARVGQSVYGADEVAAAWAAGGTDVVQSPANVFDARSMAVPPGGVGEMHYRSVFLQGILLDTPAVAEARVAGGGRLARAVERTAAEVGAPAPALLVATVLRAARPADRVVVGADSAAELQAIAAVTEIGLDTADEFIRRIAKEPVPDEDVLDPRRWRNAS